MSTLKAKALVLAVLAAAVMGIVGCGSDGKKAGAPAGATTAEPAAGSAAPADSAAPSAAPADSAAPK
jgi:hypothetical protein